MDLDDLADLVGRDLFDRACRHALARAQGYGTHRDEWKADDADLLESVPHELSDAVEGDLDLAFALHRAMPDARIADPAMYWL